MKNALTKRALLMLTVLVTGLLIAAEVSAAESSKPLKKIVLIAGKKSHGPGDHEYEKGVELLKRCFDTSPNTKGIRTEVYLNGWPQDASVLDEAATILFYCDGSDRDEKAHPLLRDNRIETIDRLMKRGVGFVAIHYAVFIPSKNGGEQYLDWMGGYFDYENGTAANKWYSKIETKEYQVSLPAPEHPIVRSRCPTVPDQRRILLQHAVSGKRSTADAHSDFRFEQVRSDLCRGLGRRTNRWRSRLRLYRRTFPQKLGERQRPETDPQRPALDRQSRRSPGRRDFLAGFRKIIRPVCFAARLDGLPETCFRRPAGRTCQQDAKTAEWRLHPEGRIFPAVHCRK
jgi:hypothetical protein